MTSNQCSSESKLMQMIENKIGQLELQKKADIEKFCKENSLKVTENVQARLEILESIDSKFVDDVKVPQKRVSTKLTKVKGFQGSRTAAESAILQSCRTFVLKKSERLPAMSSWVKVKRNVLVEDEEFLYNFPNLGDEVFDKNPAFNEDLAIKSFGGKVHCDKNGDRADDQLIMELIESLRESEDPEQDVNDSAFPSRKVFEAVSQIYPNNGSPDELRLAYEKHTSGACASEKSTLDTESVEPLSPKQFLGSYNKYFCRRCFMYGCVYHERDENTGPDFETITKQLCITEKPPKEQCGKNCHMNLEAAEQGPSDFESDDIWTGSDQSIFRVLRAAFSDNFCAIARGIPFKTCKQVFEFAQNDEDNLLEEEQSSAGPAPKKRTKPTKFQHKFRHGRLWKDENQNEESNYTPCNHAGPCGKGCRCFDRNTFCEKFCKCPPDCKKRFQGCRCKGQCLTRQCPCYIGFRECDPDICKCNMGQKKQCECEPEGCKCKKACENVRIQRGLHKHLLLAPSGVPKGGWGMFIKDGAKKNDFIYEYCGEKISKQEAERREVIYTAFDCSFLFDLNDEYAIDATRKGNKIRFANHSKKPNCYVKIIMVNGEHRIGVFANRNIEPQEELFLSYRHDGSSGFVGIENDE